MQLKIAACWLLLALMVLPARGQSLPRGDAAAEKVSIAKMLKNQIGDLKIGFGMHGDKFGYGFGIMSDKAERKDGDPAPVGTFSWGSFYYSYFWGDPKNKVIAVMNTQTWPSGHLKLREGFKKAVYEAVE